MKLAHELVILTKFHEDRTKIVDFLLIVTFLASCKFLRSPSMFILVGLTHMVVLAISTMAVLACLYNLFGSIPYVTYIWEGQ